MFLLRSKSAKDRRFRVVIVNAMFECNNKPLLKYLKIEEDKAIKANVIPYSQVTYRDIIENSSYIESTSTKPYFSNVCTKAYFYYFYNYRKEVQVCIDNGVSIFDWRESKLGYILALFGSSVALFIAIPVWILTRIFKIIYPFIILIYIIYYNIWNDIDLFQISMLFIYLLLNIIIWILSIHVFKLYHSLWHINPVGTRYTFPQTEIRCYNVIKNINEYYNDCISIPLRLKILIKIFGYDIGSMIDSFCPNFNKREFNQ